MEVVKTDAFLQSIANVNKACTNIFGALSAPTRLRIFQTLAEADEPVTSLRSASAPLQASLASHHLKCLKNCQLVVSE